MKNALILFTRVPVPGETKTRLMPFLTGEECAGLHAAFLKDTYEKASAVGADVLVFYTPEDREESLKGLLGDSARYLPQYGEDLGVRMKYAIGIALRLGYGKCVLIGSDCPQIHTETLTAAFENLDEKDIVIHPTVDGGYYLIGMKKEYESIWNIERYGTNTVIYDTLEHMKNEHLKTAVGQMYYDIDEEADLRKLYMDIRSGIVTNCPYTAQYLRENLTEKLGDRYGM